MAPITTRAEPKAMLATSGPRGGLNRGTRVPKKSWLSSATMLRKSLGSVLGVETPDGPKRCPFSTRQGDGKAFDGLSGLMAWRGGNKAQDLETGASCKISQIALAVTPAALGAELESVSVRLFHGEKKEAVRMEAGMRGLKAARKIAEVYERVGRQDQVVAKSGPGKCGFQVGNGETVVNLPSPGLPDHCRRQIHPIEPGRQRPERRPRQASAATQIQDCQSFPPRHHHRRQVQKDLRRGITQLANHAAVIIGGELIEEMADITGIGARRTFDGLRCRDHHRGWIVQFGQSF